MPDALKQDFDLSIYTANLDLVLKAAQEDYEQITFKRHAIQHGILRNYLWLATVVYAVDIYLFSNVSGHASLIPWKVAPNSLFYLFMALAMLSSCAVFMIGVYAMQNRKGVSFPYYERYEKFISLAWQEGACKIEAGTLRLEMIRLLAAAIAHQQMTANLKGKILRALCWLLLFSTGSSILALLSASMNF